MYIFRNNAFMRFLSTLAGVVFLNLSFFLTELNAIDLRAENKILYESLVKTFFNICEEEKDPIGSESSDIHSINEIDLMKSLFEINYTGYYLIQTKSRFNNLTFPTDGTSFSIHQPPEA
jgi:hypothetical protein